MAAMTKRRLPDHVDGIVAQWAKERPDLDAAPIGTFGRLLRASALTDQALAEGVAGYGLRPGWFDLLAALRRSGRPYELNPTRLMEATLLTSGGITKRLDRLEEEGLVERRNDPSDRRGTLVRLTSKGKRLIDDAIGVHAANEDRLLANLSRSERATLDELLRGVLARLEAPGADRE
jgi:DNA-binding MarR family transcriptional regulator